MPYNFLDIYYSPLPNMPSTELLLFIVNKLGLDYKISVLIVCFIL